MYRAKDSRTRGLIERLLQRRDADPLGEIRTRERDVLFGRDLDPLGGLAFDLLLDLCGSAGGQDVFVLQVDPFATTPAASLLYATLLGGASTDIPYAVAVDAVSLEEAGAIDDPGAVRLLVAAQVGPVRLIDNSGALAAADDTSAAPDGTTQVRQLERIG